MPPRIAHATDGSGHGSGPNPPRGRGQGSGPRPPLEWERERDELDKKRCRLGVGDSDITDLENHVPPEDVNCPKLAKSLCPSDKLQIASCKRTCDAQAYQVRAAGDSCAKIATKFYATQDNVMIQGSTCPEYPLHFWGPAGQAETCVVQA